MQFTKLVIFMVFLVGVSNVIEEECTQFFKKARGQLKCFWGHKGDHGVRSILEPTNINHHQTQFSHDGDLQGC